MAQCEDFPCCDHEAGCCPDFDDDGRQLNMICVCGAKLPVDNGVSICAGCLQSDPEGFDERFAAFEPENERQDEDMCYD